MYLCGFVALFVRMCVAGTNKVEDTMSLCKESMRFWHLNMTLLKVKQEHFEIAILVLHNFFDFYYG